MKVAILSESDADEAAIRILLDGLLGVRIDLVGNLPLRSRGWPSVRNVLPSVLAHLHYHKPVDAFAVVVDSNSSPLHQGPTGQLCPDEDPCRLCQVRRAVNQVQGRLRPVPGRIPVKVAVGLAVPAIEAWYLCGAKTGVFEEAWARGLQSGRFPYTKNELKQSAYGTDRPSIGLETRKAGEHASRLSADLAQLKRLFPIGFGCFASQVRAWLV